MCDCSNQFNRFMLFHLSYTVLVAAFILSACSESHLPNTSFLEGTPCAPPCWEMIEPGISSLATVESVIANPTIVVQDSITTIRSQDDPSGIGYLYWLTNGGSGQIGIKDGVVSDIGIRPRRDLTLRDLIDKYMTPDFVFVEDASEERFCYWIYLYDLDRGISIRTSVCKGDQTNYRVLDNSAYVYPELNAGSYTFFEPGDDLESTLTNNLLQSPKFAEEIVLNAQPWTGFGFYPLSRVHNS